MEGNKELGYRITQAVGREAVRIKEYVTLAFSTSIVKRGVKFSVVVGTILVFINHGDDLFAGTISQLQIYKSMLTYTVPYMVSTLSSIQASLDREQEGQG
jgi:hypothetical protein